MVFTLMSEERKEGALIISLRGLRLAVFPFGKQAKGYSEVNSFPVWQKAVLD